MYLENDDLCFRMRKKGEEILIITNYNLPNSDKIFLKSAIINLKNKYFIAADTKIKVHKDIFDVSDNDPRIEGVSSRGDEAYTLIEKGVFTSCKKREDPKGVVLCVYEVCIL